MCVCVCVCERAKKRLRVQVRMGARILDPPSNARAQEGTGFVAIATARDGSEPLVDQRGEDPFDHVGAHVRERVRNGQFLEELERH